MNAYELLAETVTDLRAKIKDLEAQLEAAEAVTVQLLEDQKKTRAEWLEKLSTVAWLIRKDEKDELAKYVEAVINMNGGRK